MVHFTVRVTETDTHTHVSRAVLTASGAQAAASPQALHDEIMRDMAIMYPSDGVLTYTWAVHTSEAPVTTIKVVK